MLEVLTTGPLGKSPNEYFLICQMYAMYAQSLSCVRLFATPQTVACRCPLSRQEYWSGLPFCPPGDHPDPRIKHVSAASLVLAGGFFFF